MGVPRVNSQDVLVVPPCECAWLSGEAFDLKDGRSCVAFEAKGGHDATVILRSHPGTNRMEHANNLNSGVSSYTIKLGSHRNTFLELERNGQPVSTLPAVPQSTLQKHQFSYFWVDWCNGTITVGSGSPGKSMILHTWTDPNPAANIRHVGLSAWDEHVAYRNIRVCPGDSFISPVQTEAERHQSDPIACRVPSLMQMSIQAVLGSITADSVCAVLEHVAGAVWPADCALYQCLVAWVAANLSDVVNSDSKGFSLLPAFCISSIAAQSNMAASELELFRAVMVWASLRENLGESIENRMESLEQIFQLVRFPLMTVNELHEVWQHPISRSSSVLRDLLEEATNNDYTWRSILVQGRDIQILPEADIKRRLRWEPRESPFDGRVFELMYVSDGDENGVCTFLGTNMGSKSFINPMVEKHILVTCSSPCGRHCDPKLLVSRRFLSTSYAGPSYSDGQRHTWWAVDLGDNKKLLVNYYTLRPDSSNNFPRSWVLQGRNDDSDWRTLRAHEGDASIGRPGQFHSWQVPKADRPYRHLRVMLTGPTTGCHSGANLLCLSSIEFYGRLFVSDRNP